MNIEHSRHEQFMSYAYLLTERFASGLLSELQPLQQWVVWRAERDREGKQKKVPYNPNHQLAHASVTVPRSWGSLDQALSALQSGTYTGLGLVITPPLAFLDLDHSYDNTTRTITDPQAHELVRTLNSYTEVSPSGKGLHLLAYGNLPGRGIHTAIELYGKDRFTTITTNHLAGTPPTIEHRQAALEALYRRFAPAAASREEQNVLWRTSGGAGSGDAPTELPAKAAQDALLQQLLHGDISMYQGDQSRADFVLVMKLLHWTGDNIDLTRRLFLSSPLGQREKAQRKTGATTYIDMTIYNVLKKRRSPPQRR